MQIIIEDNRWLRLAQLYEVHEEAIIKKFRVKDPNAYFSKAMKKGFWDGYISKYKKKGQKLSKAFLQDLIDLCEQNGFTYDIEDLRGKPKFPIPHAGSYDETLLDGITLESYQVRVLDAICQNTVLTEIGIVDATTGSGKTEVIASLVKLFRCPTVIVTEQVIVLDQIIERLKLRNVVHNNDIGLFCSGKTPENNLVIVGSIACVQTPKKPERNKIIVKPKTILNELDNYLDKHTDDLKKIIGAKGFNNLIEDLANKRSVNENTVQIFSTHLRDIYFDRAIKGYYSLVEKSQIIQKIVSNCEMLLVDEVDRSSSDLYIELMNSFSGRYRYGFSGTPYDPGRPVQNIHIRDRFGPVLVKVERKEVEDAGRIQPVVYYMIQFGDNTPDNMDAFDVAEKETIIENQDFINKVKVITDSFPNEGCFILVDTSNIEILGKALEAAIPGSAFISGKTPKNKRKEVLTAFQNRTMKVLIGSKILKRGLDLKGGTENLILIGGGKQWSNFDQIIGRAVRLTAKGESRIFDFYFTNNSYLLDHSRKRLKFINNMGYRTYVVYNGKKVDGTEFVKKRYKFNLFDAIK